MEVDKPVPTKKIIRSAGAGIASMLIAILLLVSLTGMDEQPALVILALLLVIVLGLIAPIWMFVRCVVLLLKRQNPGAPKRTFAIFLTFLLGLILLLLLAAFVLYLREDRQAPF